MLIGVIAGLHNCRFVESFIALQAMELSPVRRSQRRRGFYWIGVVNRESAARTSGHEKRTARAILIAGMRRAFTQSSMVLVVTLRRLASSSLVMSSVVSEEFGIVAMVFFAFNRG